jgi:hypothetical protein
MTLALVTFVAAALAVAAHRTSSMLTVVVAVILVGFIRRKTGRRRHGRVITEHAGVRNVYEVGRSRAHSR